MIVGDICQSWEELTAPSDGTEWCLRMPSGPRHWKSERQRHREYPTGVIHHFKCNINISHTSDWWIPLTNDQWYQSFVTEENKANLRDLIAATNLVILLKLDSNRWFFSLCDLKIWWIPPKIIGHLFYTTSSFVHHFKAISEFKLELQSGNAQFGSKSAIFCPLWPWNLTDELEKQ